MHVAIIMDGNGRWATRRGLSRSAGHAAGAKTVRATVEAAAEAGIDVLTLYAFSSANWSRPAPEVAALMGLFARYLFVETRNCVAQSIRINVIGRRDRLDASLLRSIEQSERVSRNGSRMLLRIAVDYSSRHSILQAAAGNPSNAAMQIDDFESLLAQVDHSAAVVGGVDLLIRTGCEKRLSDFMLWECAYAELYFSELLWPDFTAEQLRSALGEFASRQRRYGGLSSDAR